MPELSSDDLTVRRPFSLRKKLWLAGGGVALFLLTLVIGNFFVPAQRAIGRDMLGHDFLAFYTAGHFVRSGQADKLYDLQAVAQYQRQLGQQARLTLGPSFGPYWNPPFYAWVFAPLAGLPYHTALCVWWGMGLACLVASMRLLAGLLPAGQRDWRNWGLIPLLICISQPFLQVINHGQNTFFSLLLLTATVTLWRRACSTEPSLRIGAHRVSAALLSGMVAGLLFYKPQLGLVVAVALVINLGWRAMAGLAITGTVLGLVTIMTLPGTLDAFLHRLPANLHTMQETQPYLWHRHVTFKAFWRLLLQGNQPGATSLLTATLWGLSALALAAHLASATYRSMRLSRPPTAGLIGRRSPDGLIAATIVAMPLLMPFYFDYDLLLLAVPAVLLAAQRLGHRLEACATEGGEHRLDPDRWLVRAWVALFAWCMVGAGMANWLHIQGTVILLSIVAATHIARIYRRQEAGQAGQVQVPTKLAAAAWAILDPPVRSITIWPALIWRPARK